RTLIVNDVDAELTPAEGGDTFNSIGIKAIICCPLLKRGRLTAMMAVHNATPRVWSEYDISLVEAVVERSWAFIERARALRDLQQANRRLSLAQDAGKVGSFDFLIPEGKIVWSPALERLYGVPEGTFEGGFADWLKRVFPEDAKRVDAEIARCMANRESEYRYEFRITRPDGEIRWLLGQAQLLYDAEGNPQRMIGVNVDITEQREAAEHREQMLESERVARSEAERVSKMKDEFLATLSHELRTPLNAIYGWAQILRFGATDPAELAQGLETIERNARAQSQIIEDLLDMSRIISGKIRLDVQRLDVAAVLEAAIETVRPAANAKDIRLQATIDPHPGPVTGDPNRLQQVFWNLLSNAIKFTPRGGRVQVLLERVNSHLEIGIIDSGEGIPAAFLPHVFDRFRQADGSTTRSHGGLGLGLAIAKQLIELHGGSVRAKSAGPGQGAAFIVHLPLTVLHADSDAELARRHPSSGAVSLSMWETCANLAGLKVLVVDDEPDARDLVRRLLEDCKVAVTTVSSASEAMEHLLAQRPDVIVSDVGMPVEDGHALIRRIRRLPHDQGGQTPAVALTAYARSEDRMRAILAGFQMHLAKPVEPAELITIVASLGGRTGRSAGLQ
ncbi:MAG TPA: ATP-binding protein, partial [Tepidisphaeraceae bacterium]